jgi:DNA modification methylase
MKLDIIPASTINFGTRYREELGDIQELKESIQKQGIITPLAVQEIPGQNYLLIAGGRRLTAINELGLTDVPVRIYTGEMTELKLREIELFENLHRKDLNFIERSRLEREIHKLGIEQHGQKIAKTPDAPGWTMQQTAEMLNRPRSGVSLSVKIADAEDRFPGLFSKCKTQHDATKVLKTMEETIVRDQIVKKIEANKDKDSGKKNQLADSYILRDCLEGTDEFPDNVFNLVEIDPPYAIDLNNKKKDNSYNPNDYNEISIDDYPAFMQSLLARCYSKMTQHSWLIVWFAPHPWAEPMYEWITKAGFETTRMYGIWTKPSGQSMRPERHLGNSYECFYYARKGEAAIAKPRTNLFDKSDFPPVPAQRKTHPTERPIELMQAIYETFTWPGSRILIPFLGSGNGLIASYFAKMTAIGFDLTKGYRDSYLVKLHSMGI